MVAIRFSYAPEEREDWDYARNRFTAVKNRGSSWSQSVFSTGVNGYILPNRDYPYQGLTSILEGEHWKFLDAIGLSVERGGERLDMEPEEVLVGPGTSEYVYTDNDDNTLKAEYRVQERKASVSIGYSGEGDVRLHAAPLLDLRRLPEDGETPSITSEDGVFTIKSGGMRLLIGPGADYTNRETVEWKYKLDSGERVEAEEVRFQEDRRSLFLLEKLTSHQDSLNLDIAFGPEAGRDDLGVAGRPGDEVDVLPVDTGDRRLDRYLKMRASNLESFENVKGNTPVPEAGGFWFRQVWTRDLLFGLYENMEFYERLHGKDWLRNVLRWVGTFREGGRLPELVGRRDSYDSFDNDLLYLMCLERYADLYDADPFIDSFQKTFDAIQKHEQDHLLVTGADESWTDTVKEVDGVTVSSRVPDRFVEEHGSEAADSAYLLPEINGYWIKVLEGADRFDTGTDVKASVSAFRHRLWNDDTGLPFNLVFQEGSWDGTATSMGVEAVTRAPGIVPEGVLGKTWRTVQDRLLVKRTPVNFDRGRLPFGLLTKDVEREPFLGDRQYHGPVMWLRETVHLLRLLRLMGENSKAVDTAVNVLDHQMAEGALGYSHELFSLPAGNNPSPGEYSENPVPVKNPMQYWSQFVQPLMEVL